MAPSGKPRDDVRRSRPMTRGKRGTVAALVFAMVVPAGACTLAGGNGDTCQAGTSEVPHLQELTQAEAAAYEGRLGEQPDDMLARTSLILHYALTRYRGQTDEGMYAGRAHAQHLAWVVRHAPDAAVLDNVAANFVSKEYSPGEYAAVKDAWQSQLDRQPRNTSILENYAQFLANNEDERSRELLRAAESLEPLNPMWASKLGASYLRAAMSPAWEAEHPSAALEALRAYDRAYALHAKEEVPSLVLTGRAWAAFIAERHALAEAHANDALRAASDATWSRGDLIHHGHTILGRLALADDEVGEAKAHLLGSGRTSGSPVLGSFGPRMGLALELLERGEFEVVGAYLELCSAFWDSDRLDAWQATVAAGEVPDFGLNLTYYRPPKRSRSRGTD